MAVGTGTTNDVLALQAQFGGPAVSRVASMGAARGSGLEHVAADWSQLISRAALSDTLLVHAGLDGPQLPVPEGWPGRVVIRAHGPLLRDDERRFGDAAVLWVATSTTSAVAVARMMGGPVHVVAPLLPLDGFLALARSEPDTPVVLLDEPIQQGCATPGALLVAHLLRTHLLADAHLDRLGLVVDQSRAEAMELLAQQLRLSVRWLGVVAHPAVLHCYATSSVLLVNGDAFPSNGVYAMAAGLPIVGRATPTVREVIGDAGLLLDPDDDDTVLAEAVAEVVADSALTAALVERGRDRVKRYSPQLAAARIHEVLQQ